MHSDACKRALSACGLLELRKTVIEKTFTILFHKPHVKFHKMKQSKNLTEAKWRLGLKICEGRRAYGHAPAFSFTAQRVVAGISCGEQTWDAWPREDRFRETRAECKWLSGHRSILLADLAFF